jgi:excisionase family DNA binding protein
MPQTHSDLVAPSAEDAALAASARQAIAAGQNLCVRDLPPIVARHVMEILEATEAGNAVTVVSIEAEVTPRQAAELLNVSRPFLVGMIERGVLPARMVGSQHRLPLKDVLAYKEENRAKRRETLREMAALDQKLGLI